MATVRYFDRGYGLQVRIAETIPRSFWAAAYYRPGRERKDPPRIRGPRSRRSVLEGMPDLQHHDGLPVQPVTRGIAALPEGDHELAIGPAISAASSTNLEKSGSIGNSQIKILSTSSSETWSFLLS